MEKKIKQHTISIGHALDGITWAFTTQPNYRVHAFIAFLVGITGFFLDIHVFEWLVLIMTITFGLVVETINTAIEATTDAITREWKKEIKIAKDVSAAAMMTYSVGAIIIAIIIFMPKIIMIPR